jgi:hypothetical protein
VATFTAAAVTIGITGVVQGLRAAIVGEWTGMGFLSMITLVSPFAVRQDLARPTVTRALHR